jgi:hypothetical protein
MVNPNLERGWAIKGSKPQVVHNGDHIRLNIFGTVCPRSGEFFAIEASHCDTDVFQVFLDEAARKISLPGHEISLSLTTPHGTRERNSTGTSLSPSIFRLIHMTSTP